MIDETATFEKFGYKSFDLRPYSSKPVIVICDNCKQSRQVKKHVGVKSLVCSKCQRINQCKKIAKINRVGRKHSDETKRKIRQSHSEIKLTGYRHPNFGKKATDETKQKMSEANRKRCWSASSRAKLSKSHKGKIITVSTKTLWSVQRSGKNNHRYGKPSAHGRGCWYTKADGQKIWLRSSWEYDTAVYLDSNGYEWSYEATAYPIVFKYKNQIKHGTYRPDFKVILKKEYEEIWEVKGYWRDDAKAKFEAFVSQYAELVVKLFDRQKLTEYGILGLKKRGLNAKAY